MDDESLTSAECRFVELTPREPMNVPGAFRSIESGLGALRSETEEMKSCASQPSENPMKLINTP